MHKSEEIKDLASSLAKAQSEMSVAGLNKNNPFFKSRYADLQSVVEASRDVLSRNGLSVSQQISQEEEGSPFLVTLLMHNTGQWIMSRVKIVPVKPDVQSLSSHITYLKRVCYASIVGVVTGDEDDDGEQAVAPTRQLRTTTEERITTDQLEQLEYELEGHPSICEQVLSGLKIVRLADMPKARFMAAIERIRKIKEIKGN